ncbi:MAG: protein rep [Ignavibacteria bacterium]|nr:protein rep [Ignavibacteria bacterium]
MLLHTQLAGLGGERQLYYFNCLRCADYIEQCEDGRLRSHYCNGRLCSICQAIRTAKAISQYLPLILSFADPCSLTLTRRTVTGENLRSTIRQMEVEFRRIRDIARKKYNFDCLRKTEVTYNRESGLYHPHFHIIVDGKDVASFVLEQWLKRHKTSAHRNAQEMESVEAGNTKAIQKLFGYVTKLVTHIEGKSFLVPVECLDVIVSALYNKRALQPYGRLIQAGRETEEVDDADSVAYEAPHASTIGNGILGKWEQDAETWVDQRTGEFLVEPLRGKNVRPQQPIPTTIWD